MNKWRGHLNCIHRDLATFSQQQKIKGFLLILLILFISLHQGPQCFSQQSQVHLINGVPFFPQEEYQCGPASLASILNFWEIPVSPSEIVGDTYSSLAKGALGIDLAHYARGKGLSVETMNGSWEKLTELIEAGYPILVFVDLGFLSIQANHFMVVVGYDKDGVIVNSGKEREKKMKKRKFLRAWEKNDFWMLLITNG
jgi:ABC-type bacteriocin/lantibiotic exporter with double-glycine peptidase domain